MFIKFIFSSGSPITTTEVQAKKILSSRNQLNPVLDEQGKWTGETINKAFIVQTIRDREAEREYAHNLSMLQFQKIEASKLTPAQESEIQKIKTQIKSKFSRKK